MTVGMTGKSWSLAWENRARELAARNALQKKRNEYLRAMVSHFDSMEKASQNGLIRTPETLEVDIKNSEGWAVMRKRGDFYVVNTGIDTIRTKDPLEALAVAGIGVEMELDDDTESNPET